MNKVYIIFLISVFFILSCKNSKVNQIEKQEGAIISLLIDELATTFPPPPPPPKDGSLPDPLNIDSLNNVKTEIVVDTMMWHVSNPSIVEEKYKEFNNLLDTMPSLEEKPLNKEYIKSKTGHILIFGNSLKDSNTKYPQLIGISRISFNENMTKAVVFAGRSTNGSGFLNLYLLKKTKGKWKIVYKKNISVA